MSLLKLYAAHVEWLGQRSSLSGGERRSFARWVVKTKPDIAGEFRGKPALFHLQCREMDRARRTRRPGVGQAMLEKYAVPLTRKYLASEETARGDFASFLERVTRECRSEADLRIFLDG